MGSSRTGDSAISDAAVRAKTGRGWKDWFALLDRWGAVEKGHKATARHLAADHGVPRWWAQMVTVRYERERGLRDVGQRADRRYEVSVQRTVAAPRDRAFAALSRGRDLSRWFGAGSRIEAAEGGAFRTAGGEKGRLRAFDPPARLVLDWETPSHCPGSSVEFTLDGKGTGRTVVRVTHSRLGTKKDRERMKGYWGARMDALRSHLEGA